MVRGAVAHSEAVGGGGVQARAGRGALRSAAPRAGPALRSRGGRAAAGGRRSSGACAPLSCATPSSPLRRGERERQDLLPYEGGGGARAALAGLVWGRGEEGAGTAPCLCPAGGMGRSQPDGPGISCVWLWESQCVCVASRAGVSLHLKRKTNVWGKTWTPSPLSGSRGCCRGREQAAENIPAEPACQAGSGSGGGALAARSPSRCRAEEASAERTSPGEEPRWSSCFCGFGTGNSAVMFVPSCLRPFE